VKGKLIALTVGVAIGSSGAAGAALSDRYAPPVQPQQGFNLKPGVAYAYGGFTCTTYDASTNAGRTLVCLRNDLKGLTLAFNSLQVVGARVSPQSHQVTKVVFRIRNT
jgi:hypothetical protein